MKNNETGLINTSEPSISIFNCREIMITWLDIAECCAYEKHMKSREKNVSGLMKVLKSMIMCSALAGTAAEKKIEEAKRMAESGGTENFEKIKLLIKEALEFTRQ